ncbi:MAG TPA: hypothetical protein VM689_01920 [Aliidongia sp.]|nr:hypothetical protein [Aliidongia sp.]
MSSVRLRDRWEILPNIPLADLHSPTAQAYAVEDHRTTGQSYFALIADPKYPPRGAALNLVKMVRLPHVLTPVEFGPVDWTPDGRRCLAIIFERPAGGRLLASCEQTITPWSEAEVAERILSGLLPGIRALDTEGVPHRGIRPDNIFFRDAARRQTTLGDCVTQSPGRHQPAAYETIESAMAMPWARSAGTVADDLYALGVLCLYLLSGRPPGGDLAEEALIDEKIKRGSFAVLAGDTRLSIAMAELCRGLLIDDVDERWTFKELEHWLEGRRLTPKPIVLAPRATRAFEVAGEQCFSIRMIARALARAAEQAAHIVQGPALPNWLQRSLDDKAAAISLTKAVGDGDGPSSGGAAHDARMVARAAMSLDPLAPIRYRGLSVAVDGFGGALVTALNGGGGSVKLLVELLLARLPQFWLRMQGSLRPEHQGLSRSYDRLCRTLEDRRPGFGLERLIYELNPALHCLSPLVENRFVYGLADLLPALELAVVGGAIENHPVDRHIAAFVAHSSKKFDETVLTAIGHIDPAIKVAGMLHLLGQLQVEHGPDKLPALTQLFGRHAQILINRFHNRRTRERLGEELTAVLRDGSLVRLLQFLDDSKERQEDSTYYARARANYAIAAKAIERCEADRQRIPEEAATTASVIAAGISMVFSVLATVGSFLLYGHF